MNSLVCIKMKIRRLSARYPYGDALSLRLASYDPYDDVRLVRYDRLH